MCYNFAQHRKGGKYLLGPETRAAKSHLWHAETHPSGRYKRFSLQGSPDNRLYNVAWTSSFISGHKMKSLKPWQRLNMFPRVKLLVFKDELYTNLARSAIQFGSVFNFVSYVVLLAHFLMRFPNLLLCHETG